MIGIRAYLLEVERRLAAQGICQLVSPLVVIDGWLEDDPPEDTAARLAELAHPSVDAVAITGAQP